MPPSKKLQVQLSYRPNSSGLNLLVDSTGIKFLGEGEWKCKKHGADYRRQWRKVHLGIDAQTLEIRAIEVTDILPLHIDHQKDRLRHRIGSTSCTASMPISNERVPIRCRIVGPLSIDLNN